MECIYCQAELLHYDSYGNREYVIYGNPDGKVGEIYKCNNSEGFENECDAVAYAEERNIDYDKWEDLCCESSVSGGYFYTDRHENLHEGYPC